MSYQGGSLSGQANNPTSKLAGPRIGLIETLGTILAATSELHSTLAMIENRLDDQPSQPTPQTQPTSTHIGPVDSGLKQILESVRNANSRILELNNRF